MGVRLITGRSRMAIDHRFYGANLDRTMCIVIIAMIVFWVVIVIYAKIGSQRYAPFAHL